MKKNLALIAALLMLCLIIAGCASEAQPKELLSATIVDKTHTPGHLETYSENQYVYNWWSGDFVLVPQIKTRSISDAWAVTVLYIYSDGTNKEKCFNTSQTEWEALEIGASWEAQNER